MRSRCIGAVLILACFTMPPAMAQAHTPWHALISQPPAIPPLTQQAELTPSDGQPNTNFGWSVALSGDGALAVVGTSGADAAYIYVRNGQNWTQQATLTAKDASGEFFGASVAISKDGSTVVVGTDSQDGAPGGVYVFTRAGTTWTLQQRLVAGPESVGRSVAINADGTVIATASRDSTNNNLPSAVYVFTRTGTHWSQQAKLQGSSTDFGISLGMTSSGSTIAVGDPEGGHAVGADFHSGAVYVFSQDHAIWNQQKVTASYGQPDSDNFGESFALSNDGGIMVVGANGYAYGKGAVFLFKHTGQSWTQQAQLTEPGSSARTTGDDFGTGVAISGDGATVLAGASNTNNFSGAVYRFLNSRETLHPSDGVTNDQFGAAVALSSDGATALISAHGRASYTGAAYIFASGVAGPTPTPGLPTITPTPSIPTPTSVPGGVTVPANAGWTNTGLHVHGGDHLAITAIGAWAAYVAMRSVGPDGASLTSADNYLNLRDIGTCWPCATDQAPHYAALIGYIGSAPPGAGSYTSHRALSASHNIFVVGRKLSTKVTRTGTLWLAMNDDAYSGGPADNTGQVVALIKVRA